MKKIIAVCLAFAMALSFTACDKKNKKASDRIVPVGLEGGVLTIATECASAPYNWTQDDDSNGGVPIKDSSKFANGYDILMAKQICEYYGWELEVIQFDFESLIPAVQSGIADAVFAAQSITNERSEKVAFAGPYYYAKIVCLAKADNAYAKAKVLGGLSGARGTSQVGTVWYDCLSQVPGAVTEEPRESLRDTIRALENGDVEFIVVDLPTANAAVKQYPDLTILDFDKSGDNFKISEEEYYLGVSVKLENSSLKSALDYYIDSRTDEQLEEIMDEAMSILPY